MPSSFAIEATNPHPAHHYDQHVQALGLPENALGLLEDVVRKLACIQGNHQIELGELQHMVFCADHGVYDRSHQANLSAITSTDHTRRLLKKQAPVARACQQHNVDLTIIDCGLKDMELAPGPNFIVNRIAPGTRDFTMMPAMSEMELDAAVRLGSEQAALRMAEGAKVLSFGALGLGNTTCAAAISSALLNLQLETSVLNHNRFDPMLNRDKVDVLTQALTLHREHLDNPWSVLQHLGGIEMAAVVGAMLATAELGGLFLVDGFACSAALLVASQLYPAITDYAQFASQSAHAAQQAIMKQLGLRPLLSLNLGLGEGTGAVLAWPLIQSAVNCLPSNG